MNAKLVRDNGIIKISVNGEVLDAVGYMTYNPDGGQFPKFTAIGNRIVFWLDDERMEVFEGSRVTLPPGMLGGKDKDGKKAPAGNEESKAQ